MAEICKDIDAGISDLIAAINRLNNKLDEQNRKIQELEKQQKECCDEKKNNSDTSTPNTNNNYEKRIKKLENNQEALKTGIIETLNNFADIENTNRGFTEAFQGLYEMVTPLMDTVSTIIEFLGADTE